MTAPNARDTLMEALVGHYNKGSDARWDHEELGWIHWWQCACGYEVARADGGAYWFEAHLADALIASGLVGREPIDAQLALSILRKFAASQSRDNWIDPEAGTLDGRFEPSPEERDLLERLLREIDPDRLTGEPDGR